MHVCVQVRDRAERDKLERERAARERADRREKEAAEQARLKAEREARAAQLRRERIMMERLTKQQVRWLWDCQSEATSHAGVAPVRTAIPVRTCPACLWSCLPEATTKVMRLCQVRVSGLCWGSSAVLWCKLRRGSLQLPDAMRLNLCRPSWLPGSSSSTICA